MNSGPSDTPFTSTPDHSSPSPVPTQPSPPPLDYANPRHLAPPSLLSRPSHARAAAALVIVTSALSFFLIDANGNSPTAWLIWLGGAWYVVARITTSNHSPAAKFHMSAAAASAVLSGSLFLADCLSPASALRILREFRWNAGHLRPWQFTALILAPLSLFWFILAQILDRRVRRNPAS